jgi:acetyl esterase/lipase
MQGGPASVLPVRATRAEVVARINAHDLGGTPEAMRAGFRRLALGEAGPFDGLPADVVVEPAGGGHRIRPASAGGRATPDAPVLWFHGGGYAFGSPDTHLRPAAWLAAMSGRAVTVPPYRLAPEHPWPAQLEDALAAVEAHPGAALAGDSAGGHLALVTALERARRGRPVEALLLFSPNTDRSGLNGARAAMSAVDPMVDDAEDRRLADLCLAGIAPSHPQASPLLDDLSLLPPMHLEVGLPEVLHDDARLLADRARAAGARVDLVVTPGLTHMAQLWAPWWDEATDSLRRGARFLRGAGAWAPDASMAD